MLYLIAIGNKFYEFKSKAAAYTMYNKAGHEVNKTMLTKESADDYWKLMEQNVTQTK